MKTNQDIKQLSHFKINGQHLFLLSMVVVNGGNYLYNLILGRMLGPEAFADAAILITFLLVLSFIGMTFQIVTTKFCVLFSEIIKQQFILYISKLAFIFGLIIGLLLLVFSKKIQIILNTDSDLMFKLFGIGIPIYFLMSVNRGMFQGANHLFKMSITYLTEMISRLVITILILLYVPNLPSSIAVSVGITLSLVFGLIPLNKLTIKFYTPSKTNLFSTKSVVSFFALTAFYELTQIIINNSDVILVKHYFTNDKAGLYASLALIGRVVYFLTWIFVMMLLPKVIKLNKEGKNANPILLKYVVLISFFSLAIVLVTFLFPEIVVELMFGEKYLSIAPLLWKYALATSLFSISNVFAYYYLSISKYIPVVISAILGCMQIVLIIVNHKSLHDVVQMQLFAMIILLIFQFLYFISHNKYQLSK